MREGCGIIPVEVARGEIFLAGRLYRGRSVIEGGRVGVIAIGADLGARGVKIVEGGIATDAGEIGDFGHGVFIVVLDAGCDAKILIASGGVIMTDGGDQEEEEQT